MKTRHIIILLMLISIYVMWYNRQVNLMPYAGVSIGKLMQDTIPNAGQSLGHIELSNDIVTIKQSYFLLDFLVGEDTGGTWTICGLPENSTLTNLDLIGDNPQIDFNDFGCGVYCLRYTVSNEDCFPACEDWEEVFINLPCGTSDDCCDKYTIEINAPFEWDFCADGCVIITATTNNYTGNATFEWSTGETGNSIEVCESGEYSVIVMEDVSDSCMCMHNATAEIQGINGECDPPMLTGTCQINI